MKPLFVALLALAGSWAFAQEPPARALLEARRQALAAALKSPGAPGLAQALQPLSRELDSFSHSEPASTALVSKAKSDVAAALASSTRAAAYAVEADLDALLSPGGAAQAAGGRSALSPAAQRAAEKARAAMACADRAFDGGACGASGSAAVAVSAPSSPAAGRQQIATLSGQQRGLVTAPVPPVAAPAPSPAQRACLQATSGYQSLSGMCADGHTTVAPLVAGLFDSLKGQFGTLSGVLMNVLFFLFGLLTSVATGGVGLVLKLIGLIGMSWGLAQALRGLISAVRQYVSSPAGSPQKSLALRKLGLAGGGLLIMVMMALGGWGLGKTKAGAAATDAMESGMQTALDKTGLGGLMKSANVALAPLMAWLSKAMPGGQNAPAPAKAQPAIAEQVPPGVVGKVVDPELYQKYRDAAGKYAEDPNLIAAHMDARGQGLAVPHDRLGHVQQVGKTCAACSIANACRLPTGDVPRLVEVLGEGPNASDVLNVTRRLGGKVVSASEIAETAQSGHPVIVALKIGRESQHAIVIDGAFSYRGRTFYSATDSNFGHPLYFPEASFDKMAATGGIYFPDGIDRGALARLEPLATDRPAAEPVQAALKPGTSPQDAFPVGRYLSQDELNELHPAPKQGPIYHDIRHSQRVAQMAYDFARGRGLAPADAKFVGEVALLHDFDPARPPGTPARVPETLAALDDDFAGRKSLTGEPGHSILKERFGWDQAQLKMAEAMIQRTEFPFGDSHPNPYYKTASPLTRYQEMLDGLPPGDRRFVLREGALLSEYADKTSHYSTEDFSGVHDGIIAGLTNEINAKAGQVVTTLKNMVIGNAGFLSGIGDDTSFALDRQLAARYGMDMQFPSRQEAFAQMPDHYGRRFEANLEGSKAAAEAYKNGATPEQARAAGATAAELKENELTTAGRPAARPFTMDEAKFKYFFGQVTDPKNAARSRQVARVLAENGIQDTPSGRQTLMALIDLAFRAEPIKTEARPYGQAVVKPVQLPTAQLQVTFFYENGSATPKVTTIIPREFPKAAPSAN